MWDLITITANTTLSKKYGYGIRENYISFLANKFNDLKEYEKYKFKGDSEGGIPMLFIFVKDTEIRG